MSSMYTRPCTRLNRREQNAWVRDAITDFFTHYEMFDLMGEHPDPPEDSDPRGLKLSVTHGWILEEFGMNNLISFIRGHVFNKLEERSAAESFSRRVGRELTEDDWGKIDSASKAPKLFRVRYLFNSLIAEGIEGQPNIGRFLLRWLINSDPKKITTTLRMRKAVHDAGKLTQENDNPTAIYELFWEVFKDQLVSRKRSGFQKPCAEYMVRHGYAPSTIAPFLDKLKPLPPSRCYIKPGSCEIDGFVYKVFRKRDPDIVSVGDINDSCMTIGSHAESSLLDAINNPWSSLMMISRHNVPVAHTWLRKGRSGILYLDNIEVASDYHNSQELASSVMNWAKIQPYTKVRIGVQFTYLPIEAETVPITVEMVKSEFRNWSQAYTDLKAEGAWEIAGKQNEDDGCSNRRT